MECLVSKLNVSLVNDNIDYLGAITFVCNAFEAGTTILIINVVEGCVAECIGDGIRFNDNSKTKAIKANTDTAIKTNGVAGKIIIRCKEKTIKNFNCTKGNNLFFDLESLKFQNNCIDEWLLSSSSTSEIKGNINMVFDALSDSCLSTPGFSGIGFNNFPNVTGTLEDALVSALTRGISNTDLQIRTANSGITLNETVPGTCYCVLDADAGTINIYSNSAHSTLRASYANGNWSY